MDAQELRDLRETLRVAGVPVGQHLTEDRAYAALAAPRAETGSIIIVVGTDAPLLPQQLKRLAKRAALGLARVGGMAGNGSGDIFIAFSTANEQAAQAGSVMSVQMHPNETISPLFDATALATEEAIVNALVAAQTMTGRDGITAHALPHGRLRELMATP